MVGREPSPEHCGGRQSTTLPLPLPCALALTSASSDEQRGGNFERNKRHLAPFSDARLSWNSWPSANPFPTSHDVRETKIARGSEIDKDSVSRKFNAGAI